MRPFASASIRFWVGNRGAVGDGEGLVEVARAGDVADVQAQRAGQLRRPAQRQQAAVGVLRQHRAPVGFGDVEFDRLRAGDLDAFAMVRHAHACVVRRSRRRAFALFRPVVRIDVAVGEAPGDVAVAADHHQRQAGQGDALHVDAAAGARGSG